MRNKTPPPPRPRGAVINLNQNEMEDYIRYVIATCRFFGPTSGYRDTFELMAREGERVLKERNLF